MAFNIGDKVRMVFDLDESENSIGIVLAKTHDEKIFKIKFPEMSPINVSAAALKSVSQPLQLYWMTNKEKLL